jgi:hypothetical protein
MPLDFLKNATLSFFMYAQYLDKKHPNAILDQPEHQMSKTKSSYLIPFNSKGNMVKYSGDRDIVEWKDNFEFYAHIHFLNFERGRSAAHAIFEGPEDDVAEGKIYQVFLTDLAIMIPYMNQGLVEGTFTFCKRGQNYGVKLVKADT